MKILEITSQHRRDFRAVMVCEFCQDITQLTNGYDDRNYHDNVIPNMVCKKCDKSTISENGPVEFVQTKYPSGMIL